MKLKRINVIGRNFLDNFPQLRYFDAVNNSWTISGLTTIETARRGLAQCFDNFVPVPDDDELRRFVIEMRGSLSLKFENGTEIIRV